MSTRFEWQTDVDERWEAAGPVAPADKPARPWRFWLMAVLVVCLAGVGLAREAGRQVQQAEAAATDEVLASDRLVRYAAGRKDRELFIALLSGSDGRWTEAQLTLFDQGMFLDRPPFGLALAGESAAEAQTVTVSFSPEMDEATVVAAEAVVMDGGQGVMESVRLERTAVYRRGNERWLLSPPTETFWGQRRVARAAHLLVSYPARDESIVGRLVFDLDKALSDLCLTLPDECSSGLYVDLSLTADPAAFLTLKESPRVLPTPTLVGRPVDEAGYQVLYQAYARLVLRPVVAALLDVEDEVLTEVVVRQVLNGPQPASLPLPDQDVQLLCGGERRNRYLYRYDPTADAWLAELGGRTFIRMSALPDDVGVLLEERLPPGGNTFEQKRLVLWRAFEESIVLDGTPRSGFITFYNWSDLAWKYPIVYSLEMFQGLPSLFSLSLDSCQGAAGCSLQRLPGVPVWSPDKRQAVIWNLLWAGSLLLRSNEAEETRQSLGVGQTPFWLDNRVYGYVYEGTAGETLAEIRLASTADDAAWTLLTVEALREVVPGEERPATLTIRHVAADPRGANALFVAATQPVPADARGDISPSLSIFHVRLNEQRTGPAAISLVATMVDVAVYPPFHFTPDGRWLAAMTTDETQPHGDGRFREGQLFLREVVSGRSRLLPAPRIAPAPDWSADGKWLAAAENDYLLFYAPSLDYTKTVFHDQGPCDVAAWVD